jgi:hypothetical protein
MDAE